MNDGKRFKKLIFIFYLIFNTDEKVNNLINYNLIACLRTTFKKTIILCVRRKTIIGANMRIHFILYNKIFKHTLCLLSTELLVAQLVLF